MKLQPRKCLPALLLAMGVAGCSGLPGMHQGATYDAVQDSLQPAVKPAAAAAAAPDRELLPPIALESPMPAVPPVEPRFDLAVADAPAAQVFLALVSGTQYSMLLPPELSGTMTLNLKRVTVPEALEVIRDLYGYDFKIRGKRISVLPNTAQTRIFQVSYLASKRGGSSSTRVMSSLTAAGNTSTSSGSSSSSSNSSNPANDGTNVYTGQLSDFWLDLGTAVATVLNCSYEINRGSASQSGSNSTPVSQIIGQRIDNLKCPDGRRFNFNAQGGLLMVRALPSELREIEQLLKTLQANVDRQVMLEAKIIEVSLSDEFQSGINWAALDKSGRHRWSMNGNTDNLPISGSVAASTTATTLSGTSGMLNSFSSSPAMTLAFQTGSFAALIDFLQTQGSVYVMSSPRIATLNNQKAVLKVGNDDYYITSVTPPTTNNNSGTTTTNPPSIETQPFFSGISLDVTPQIDDAGNITLHIRPAITDISEKDKVINFGDLGSYTLPYASSKVKEADSIVRVRDGNIVAIGGLMSQEQSGGGNKVPVVGDIPLLGQFFKTENRTSSKSELVILIKPTVIHEDSDWQEDMSATQERMRGLDPRKLPANFMGSGPNTLEPR